MKKVIIAVVLLFLVLIGGLVGLVLWLLQTPETDGTEAIPVVGQSEEKEKKKKKEQPEPKQKVIKPFETEADLMEAITKAYKNNDDTVGWLYVPNTTINDSVLQSNNNTYYLRLTEKKEPSVYGCYFADYTCNFGTRDQLSPNTIIFGHSNLKDEADGPKFSQLFHFTDETFARENPAVVFATQEEYMTWQIFAVFYTESDMQYYHGDLQGAEFQAIVEEAKKKSLFQYDVPVAEGDKILTLSTCTVKYGTRKDQRFVLMAKLLPYGQEPPKTASLTVNPDPAQPNFDAE